MKKVTREKAGPALDNLSFEQALAQVEAIIERIESGEVGLEESLEQYERGVALVNHCRGKLDRAQQRVEDLTQRLERADEQDAPPGPAERGGDGPLSRDSEQDDDPEP